MKTTLSKNINSALKQIRKDKEKTLLQKLEDYAELKYDPIAQYSKMKRTNSAVTSAALTQAKLDEMRLTSDPESNAVRVGALTIMLIICLNL